MFRPLIHFLILASLVIGATQCGKAPSEASSEGDSPVLATVGGVTITEADLIDEARWRLSQRQPLPSAPDLLDELVRRQAMLARARAEGIDEEVATRRQLENLIIARLRERDLEGLVAQAEISEEELRQAYEQRAPELAREAKDRFAVLFIEAPATASETRRAEALQRLQEGLALSDAQPAPGGRGPAASGFGSVAINYSDDQVGRYRGGDIGWVDAGASSARVPDAVLAAGRPLGKGERSEVIETDQGCYSIMKTDTRAGGVPSFEEVSPRLSRELLVAKRESIQQAFLDESLEAAGVSINEDALEKVSLPKSSETPSRSETGLLAPPSANR